LPSPVGGQENIVSISVALSPLGERVDRDRRFHQPARAG